MDENSKPIGNLFGIPIIVDANLKPDEWYILPNYPNYRSIDDLIRDLSTVNHPTAKAFIEFNRKWDEFTKRFFNLNR